MQLIWTLIIGLIIGAVAKFLMPGKDPEASSSQLCSASPGPSSAPSSEKC